MIECTKYIVIRLCVPQSSKWTTLATVGREIIEDADGVSANDLNKKQKLTRIE